MEGSKRVWGTEVLQRGPGHSKGTAPMGTEAEDIINTLLQLLLAYYANNSCNNVLTKAPIFQHGNFRGRGTCPLAPPPSLRPCVRLPNLENIDLIINK